MTEMTGGDRVHRALAAPSRRRLIALLRESGGARGAAELAAATGLSVATVRHHLAALAEAGLVRATTRAGPGRGRPRLTWTAVGAASGVGTPDAPYRELADALAGALAGNADASRAAGRDWGRRLAAAGGGHPAERVVELASRMGFRPEETPAPGRDRRVLLHGCPYRETARARPEVICSVHQGVLDGLLEGTGMGARLRPFVAPELCAVELGSDRPNRTKPPVSQAP
ncbi:helix-turn-helix transcriptional regulator [Streptomyces sp. NPDC048337]|uniref:helix-turn-helix transcriptional regulator n=1 Tax=Streptomyces sp. NPDC048337 TaxID=3365535 RepID=UPI0037186CEC